MARSATRTGSQHRVGAASDMVRLGATLPVPCTPAGLGDQRHQGAFGANIDASEERLSVVPTTDWLRDGLAAGQSGNADRA